MSENNTELSRRDFLKKGALAIVGGAVAVKGLQACSDSDTKSPKPELGSEKELLHKEKPLFENTEAQSIANRLGIAPSSFWRTEAETMERIRRSSEANGYLVDKRVLPIFPAAVYEHSDVMRRVSEELKIPINVIATIAAIESAGIRTAASSVANGLVQVVPGYHFDKIVKVAKETGQKIIDADMRLNQWRDLVGRGTSLKPKQELTRTQDVIEALKDPYLSCKVGMQIIKEYYHRAVRKTGLDPNSPVAWTRALAAYNGGPDEAEKDYDLMPREAQLYAVHAIRYFMTAEIAAQLRNKGYSDSQIAKALVSKENDARAWAYLNVKKGNVGKDIKSYERVWNILADPLIQGADDPKLANRIREFYDQHMEGDHKFDLPVSPALRLWLAHGGLGLFEDSKKNLRAESYIHVNANP